MNRVSVAIMICLACLSFTASAQIEQGKAEVWAIIGSVTFTPAGGTSGPAKLGTVLPPGSIIKTGPGAAVDLYFGSKAGVLRLAANTTLAIERYDDDKSAPLNLQLDLIEGSVLGSGNKLPTGAKYQIKLANGIAGIVNGDFRINGQGYLVLLKGKMAFVHVPASGEPAPHHLSAPPAVYFSPTEGVKEAPAILVREVNNQLSAKIGGR
jgi:hypothetical protein